METAMEETPQEGEEPKSINDIVGGVISKFSQSSKFLVNMGVSACSSQSTTHTSTARIRELEEMVQGQTLQIENASRNEQELRATVSSQQGEIMDLKRQVEEAKESNKRNEEQMAIFKQMQEKTDSLVLRLLGQSSIV